MGEAALVHDGLGAGEEGIAFEGCEEAGEGIGDAGAEELLHVHEVFVGHAFAGEVPDDGAELELGVEAEAVVDGPDVAVGVDEAVPALAVGAVGEQVEDAEPLQLVAVPMVVRRG